MHARLSPSLPRGLSSITAKLLGEVASAVHVHSSRFALACCKKAVATLALRNSRNCSQFGRSDTAAGSGVTGEKLHRRTHGCNQHYREGPAKEWSLGRVNLRPTARGSPEAGFTQPRDHSLAEPCTLHTYGFITSYQK